MAKWSQKNSYALVFPWSVVGVATTQRPTDAVTSENCVKSFHDMQPALDLP